MAVKLRSKKRWEVCASTENSKTTLSIPRSTGLSRSQHTNMSANPRIRNPANTSGIRRDVKNGNGEATDRKRLLITKYRKAKPKALTMNTKVIYEASNDWTIIENHIWPINSPR
jgi:hypothetical protein